MKRTMRATGVALCLVVLLCAGAAEAQDVLTVGSVSTAATSVEVPIDIRDVSNTTLGVDQPSGSRIQGISFRIAITTTGGAPAYTVNLSRAGITAALSPIFENVVKSGNTISYIGSFDETTNPIPFTSNAPAPGNQIAKLTFSITSGWQAGAQLSMTVDSSSAVTLLSNQAGTVSESVANGKLALTNGTLSYPAAPGVTGVNPVSGPTSGGTSVGITGTNFAGGATVTFGGAAAASVTVNSSTSITAITPAHAAGTVDVIVTSGGQSGTLAGGFTYTETPAADLAVSVDDSSDPVVLGTDVAYTVTLHNNSGSVAAAGVTLTTTLTAGLSVASAASSQMSCGTNGNTVTCTETSVSAGGMAVVTIVAHTTLTGLQTVAAGVTSTTPDSNSGNNAAAATTSVTGSGGSQADLWLTKTASAAEITAGSNLTYTITVANAGPDTASSVTMSDPLGQGVNFVSGSATQGGCSLNGNIVTCSVGTLAPGGSSTITLVVQPIAAGQLMNTATTGGAETDPNATNNQATATTTVNVATSGPDLTAAWSRIKKSGKSVSARLRSSNIGNANAGKFTITVYTSADTTVDSGDKRIGSYTINGLSAGKSSKALRISARAGSRKYLIAAVDSGNAVTEGNETNNMVIGEVK